MRSRTTSRRPEALIGISALVLVAYGCAAGGGDATDGGAGGSGGFGGSGAMGPGGGSNMGGGSTGGGRTGFGGGAAGDDNKRPALTRIGDRQVAVGELLEIQLEATDPEGDLLFFNVRSSLPEGAKFEKELGKFSWQPVAQIDPVLVTFEVSDGTLRDQETVQLTVVGEGQNQNLPPVVDEIGDHALEVGRPFELQLEASDPNGDKLAFSMRGEVPQGATLGADTGLFQWTPEMAQAGQAFPVAFVVSDGQLETVKEAKLVVAERMGGAGGSGGNPGANLPPRIDPIDDREVRVGQEVSIRVVASDPNEGQPLTYGVIAETRPPGANFDPSTQTFTWTPGADAASQAFRVVFFVSDGEFRSVERATIQVLAADEPDPVEPGMCVPDPGDPGVPVPIMPGAALPNRTICPGGDIDDYTFQANEGQRIVVEVRFRHADGDLDLRLYAPNQQVFRSLTVTDDERIETDAPATGQYRAEVFGWGNVVHPNYAIEVTLSDPVGPMGCQDDAADSAGGNDTAETASDLRQSLGQDLQICAGDLDFYWVDLQAGAQVTLRALFSHAAGDIDVELTGPAGFRRFGSSASDNEALVLDPVPAAGRYVLQVEGYEGAENSYRLELEEQAGAMCEPDRLEPNDNRGAAEPLNPELYNGLTYCGDEDWFRSPVSQGDTLQVYVTYDGAAPQMTLYDAQGAEVPGQSFAVAMGDGCQANRGACRLLSGEAPADGQLWYSVTGFPFNTDYDLRVRVQPGAAPGQCSENNQICDLGDVCDYQAGQCVGGFCDRNGLGCPNGYMCHQEWCVEGCDQNDSCLQRFYACKVLDGRSLCGYEGLGGVGEACDDFSDCGADLDCLTSAPGGYCSRQCQGDADCGADGACAVFPDGNFCSRTCVDFLDCRGDYSCTSEANAAGGVVDVCTPGVVI